MMNICNLIHVVNFPTRISNDKGTLIYNIFMDFMRLNCYSVYPVKIVLSDSDVQILFLNKLQMPFQKITSKNKIRLINAETIAKFQLLLSGESWDSIYITDNTDSMFNFFIVPF
jgi:hypothetical protein